MPGLARRLAKQRILCIDLVCQQNGKTIISGWLADRESALTEKSLVINGSTVDLFTFERPDVTTSMRLPSTANCFGFIGVTSAVTGDISDVKLNSGAFSFPMREQRYKTTSSAGEVIHHVPSKRDKASDYLKVKGVDVGKTPDAVVTTTRSLDKDVRKIKDILDGVNVFDDEFFDTANKHVLPEIQRIWKARISKFKSSELQELGAINEQPEASIIIPLYGRYDFIQHQIAAFSTDPGFADIEVIYVVDDPEIARIVKIVAHGTFETFRYPFKVVYSDFNRGFSGANNLGVKYANSKYVLLLNSDILPRGKGWLIELLQQHKAIPNCGILGATLLYEDNTVQHMGMEFRRDSHYPGILMNHHPYKGVPVQFIKKPDYERVDITTGACMLMEKTLFEDIGGFDPLYVLGDFEDSDLCLKVNEKGLGIYCSFSVHLYHLERLSQNLVDQGDWKFKLTLINGIYQMQKWPALLEEYK